MVTADLETVLNGSDDLPPTPQIIPKVQALLRDDDAVVDDLVTLLKADPGLVSRIIKVANSAYYGGSAAASSLDGAIGRIGFQEAYRIASLAATQGLLGRDLPLYRMGRGQLWHRSLATAVIAETLAEHTGLDADTAYTIGLLHSLGKIVINQYYLDRGMEIYGESDADPLPEMEKRILGFNNADVAAAMLRRWNFDESSVIPVEFQYGPLDAPCDLRECCLLHLAAETAVILLEQPETKRFAQQVAPEVLEMAGITAQGFDVCILESQSKLESMEDLLKVS